mgnify:CR=1 FL=1
MTETTLARPVAILDAVGAALRTARAHWRFMLMLAAIAGVAQVAIIGIELLAPQSAIALIVFGGLLQAFLYAAALGAVLGLTKGFAPRAAQDGVRVWSAMAIVSFFLFIVFFFLLIPGSVILAAGPLSGYVNDLNDAHGDQARVMEIMMRFATANPGWVAGAFLVYAALWLAFTSRLYLSAPASVEQGRILTFETWNSTKGNMVRIMAARLMLLLPAFVLSSCVPWLVGSAIGIDGSNPMSLEAAARANPPLVLAYAFVERAVWFAVYTSLEAGLSAALYRALKRAAPAPQA